MRTFITHVLAFLLVACAVPDDEVTPRAGDSEAVDCSEGLCPLLMSECEDIGHEADDCWPLLKVCGENKCKACALAGELDPQLAELCEAAACIPDVGICATIE